MTIRERLKNRIDNPVYASTVAELQAATIGLKATPANTTFGVVAGSTSTAYTMCAVNNAGNTAYRVNAAGQFTQSQVAADIALVTATTCF